MKNEFSRCPHCKEVNNGAWVYECNNCGRIMCYNEGVFGFNKVGCWKNDRCPDCASHRKKDGVEIIKAIGIIYKR
jgi:hypothetical protein